MADEAETLTGACHCGAVRYRASGPPVLVEFCHCKSCRDATGAPLVAWTAFAMRGFEFTSGDPSRYASSEGVERTFCGRCGTSLTLTDQRFAEEIYATNASFDDPEAFSPEFHIWRSHRLSWLETADTLRRYVQFKSDGIEED